MQKQMLASPDVIVGAEVAQGDTEPKQECRERTFEGRRSTEKRGEMRQKA